MTTCHFCPATIEPPRAVCNSPACIAKWQQAMRDDEPALPCEQPGYEEPDWADCEEPDDNGVREADFV